MSTPPARDERPLAVTLAAAIRAARLRAELSPGEVARRVGVRLAVYGRIERGDSFPSVPTLRRLCVVLAIAPNELLGLLPQEPCPDMHRLRNAARELTAADLRLLYLLAGRLLPTPGE